MINTANLRGAGAALTIIAGAASSHGMGLQEGVQCFVRERHVDKMSIFEGVVRSPHSISGEYRFAVEKSDVSGRSMNRQQGPFFIETGTETIIASISTDIGQHAVSFEISINSQTISCPLQSE